MGRRGACHEGGDAVKYHLASVGDRIGLADDPTNIDDRQEVGLKSSTLFRIGFIGSGISVIFVLIPIVVAVFGNSEITTRISAVVNEKLFTVVLIFFSAIIFLAVRKKREESILAYIEKQGEEKH
jgi:heme/copper-type cytochrome/quinol oxidase subunit 4